MFSWKKYWQIDVICLLLIIAFFAIGSIYVYADGGDGSGNTSGVFKPLGLVSVTIEDGTDLIDGKDIPLSPKFTFHFDKNVVYLLYWKRNVDCFHLYDEEGKELAINVTKIDDTVDFSKRQYIWVEPVEPLSPGTAYSFFVSPDLLAKNGGSTLAMTTNGEGETILFKTEGEKVEEKSSTAIETQKPVTDSASSQNQKETAKSTSQNLNSTSLKAANSFERIQQGMKMQNYVAGAGVVLIAGWLFLEVFRRKKSR